MIAHNKPSLGQEENDALGAVLATGWVAQGPQVAAFEDELCAFFGLPDGHAVVVSSGSAALYLALWSLDAKGKKIALPVYACSALPNAIDMIGGQKQFHDCAQNSPNLDWDSVAGENPDIVLAPSIFGIPVEVPKDRPYKVVEDLAQAMGSKINGAFAGLHGDIAICSFYATKLMTSGGQGGAVLSSDKALIEAIKDYREFDCREDRRPRFNFQMTDVQAAIGREQLRKLPVFLEKREQNFQTYVSKGLDMLKDSYPHSEAVRYRAVLKCRTAEDLKNKLKSNDIHTIIPVETYELLDEPQKYPHALNLTQSTLSLPVYPSLKQNEATQIADIILENL